ncbi:ROK family glucokinase [Cryptosporangium phraense]|uniref:Glucokinase n=1 Tax=Cryptosporangium phraense TaxID=2593070 RepID=A0A545ATD9_9ACTN|nr:ROK family glucokinase [Cryptosporangium phraense]TQS44582.1 ROK family glucokinase [Cryptosporangium phraense]
MTLTVGVDVGGTKVLAGVVTPDGEVLATVRRPTPSQDVNDTARVIAEVVRELDEEYDVEAVGVGAAGWIDASRSVVLHAPNLAWRREPLKDRIQERVDVPVVVENDANAAAWAEYRFGAGQDQHHLILITVGTGIGGGAVVNGDIYRGHFGVAAEFGHVRVVPDGHPCGCGASGCFEQYASGKALVRFAKEQAREDKAAARVLLEMAGGDVDAIDGPMVTRAAQAGDAASLAAFADLGDWLGWGMADLVSGWDPQCIILGGGVAEAGDLMSIPARETYAKVTALRGRTDVAEVRIAALGNKAGLVGAADLARIR